jgi:tetratricopeptide (TPR) repeat protein
VKFAVPKSKAGTIMKYASSLWLFFSCASFAQAASADALFNDGIAAYQAADFSRATAAFREAATQQPAAGTFRNLGNAEWHRGRVGAAIIAWEQARWLDPYDTDSRNNLRFARATAQLETPELAWYEVGSTWLPLNGWAWITGASLWLVAGALTLPGILRRRKAGWYQAMVAVGLTLFLLSLPAHVGVRARSQIGFVLIKNTPLRLTPTAEAQVVTRLAAGEPARWERQRGNYFFIRSSRAAGWVERDEFGLVCPK